MPFNKDTLAVMLAIVIQTCGIVWWAACLSTRVSVLEAEAAKHRVEIVETQRKLQVNEISNSIIIERPDAMRATLSEIKQQRSDGNGKTTATSEFKSSKG